MKCPAATHKYRPHGKFLICSACADVQPLLMSEPDDVPPPSGSIERPPRDSTAAPPPQAEYDASEIDRIEATAALLREAAGLTNGKGRAPMRDVPEQLDLGVRRSVEGQDLVDLSNAQATPRVPVYEGFAGSEFDEALPDPGL